MLLINYKKAVKTAALQKDGQLEFFQQNLKAFKEKIN